MMKPFCGLAGVVAVMMLTGCAAKPETPPDGPPPPPPPPPSTVQILDTDQVAALNGIREGLISRFYVYEQVLNLASRQLTSAHFQGKGADDAVQMLAGAVPSIRMAGMADANGNILFTYPKIFQSQEGSPLALAMDVKLAAAQIRAGANVLSGAHRGENGAMLVTYLVPVKGPDQIVIGAVFLQFQADEILRRIVTPEINGLTVNIWIMQLDGLIIYDTNSDEIGLNVLLQEPFIRFPSLVGCARQIITLPTGAGRYVYLSKGSKLPIGKSAQWTTFSRGGREWRIIMNLEDRPAL